MYNDPNQPQQPPYGQPQPPYEQPPSTSGQSPYGQPPPAYGQPQQWGQQAQAQYGQQLYGQAQLQYVGVGPRFLALLIDAILIGIVTGLLTSLLRNAPGVAGLLDTIIVFGYYIVLEATQGATVGKMALGLRVVKTNGAPITWTDSIIRNLLRIIDGLFAYLVGAILIWSSPLKQRLGDRAANTVVVKRPR
jgi:uncharacterized RDD family membrane protein YckC